MGRNDAFAATDRPAWGTVPVSSYRGIGPMGYAPALRRRLVESGADLVHQHGIWMYDQWAALQWQRWGGRCVVISPHGMLDPWALKNSSWKKVLAGRLFADPSLHRATCLHALCRSEVDAIRAYGLKNPVALIPNGVDLPEVASAPDPHAEPNGRRTLLFLGRIHPKKGIRELLEAWNGAGGVWRNDWRLVVAGWDDRGCAETLKQQFQSSASGAAPVVFSGPVHGPEKDQLLRSADAFILPSFSEGLPVSVLEAWAYRLPVLMTGPCNLPEGFDVGAALRIEPTIESIRQGLRELAAMPDGDLRMMGDRGRTLVEEKFAWPGIASQMKQVYEWCLTGSNPPDCLEE
jgi:poly(glycerol-phosphate) alpha-glucosyltransferase